MKNGSKLKFTYPTNNFNGLKVENLQPFYFVELRFPCASKNNLNSLDNKIFEQNNLGKNGDLYLITDTRNKSRKDLAELKTLQKYNIANYNNTVTGEFFLPPNPLS